jgi:hypothetical protein
VKKWLGKVWYRYFFPFWEWLKCHVLPSHRYHIVNLRCPSYVWGFIYPDEQIFLALFTIMANFVERKALLNNLSPQSWIGSKVVNYNYVPHIQKDFLELQEIYNWWMSYNQQVKASHFYGGLDSKEEEMMIRLIKVRHILW